jgi:hypothetical protein
MFGHMLVLAYLPYLEKIAYVPYIEKIKAGLYDHHAVCVCLCVREYVCLCILPINFCKALKHSVCLAWQLIPSQRRTS